MVPGAPDPALLTCAADGPLAADTDDLSAPVPVNAPWISPQAQQLVAQAVAGGWLSSAGPAVAAFERAFADWLGVADAVTTNSGTTALHLALAALGIGPGDEVVVPDFTMISPVAAVLYCGATPVFVDAEPASFGLDLDQVEAAITPRTKAILPVHLYGHAVDMTRLKALADKHRVPIVEDAAQAHGARDGSGRLCGSVGLVGCFSLYGNKLITAGEGGVVVTRDVALARQLRSLRDMAHDPARRFHHLALGYSYRMGNLQAACALGQLQVVDRLLAQRRWMHQAYTERLKHLPMLQLPTVQPGFTHSHWMMTVLVDPDLAERSTGYRWTRDTLCQALREQGLETRTFFESASQQPVVRDALARAGLAPPAAQRFPVSARLADQGLYLPSGLALTAAQLDRVCTTINTLMQQGQR